MYEILQLTIILCKSQRHFVSAAAAILKEVSLGPNLTQSRCGCAVVCQSFGRTATFCKNWEIVDSLSSVRHMAESIDSHGAEHVEIAFHRHSRWLSLSCSS